MNDQDTGSLREARRNDMANLLARYPALNDNELAELLHWFKKEASALEAALISSDEKLQVPYESLKKDHLDRLRGADVLWALVIAGGGFLAIALLIWKSL